MIDLHCHYLPGVDDGARTIEEAAELITVAAANGISHAVITPHIHPNRYNNQLADLRSRFVALQQALMRLGALKVRLALAAEVRLTSELLIDLPRGELPFIGRYQGREVLLLELPYSHVPPGTEKCLQWLASHGVTAMIAHPERNREIISDPQRAALLKRQGAMLQGTVSAFVGEFGAEVQTTAEWLLQHDLFDVVASDAHRIGRREPRVKEGLAQIAALAGQGRMAELSQLTPAAISRDLFDERQLQRGGGAKCA